RIDLDLDHDSTGAAPVRSPCPRTTGMESNPGSGSSRTAGREVDPAGSIRGGWRHAAPRPGDPSSQVESSRAMTGPPRIFPRLLVLCSLVACALLFPGPTSRLSA